MMVNTGAVFTPEPSPAYMNGSGVPETYYESGGETKKFCEYMSRALTENKKQSNDAKAGKPSGESSQTEAKELYGTEDNIRVITANLPVPLKPSPENTAHPEQLVHIPQWQMSQAEAEPETAEQTLHTAYFPQYQGTAQFAETNSGAQTEEANQGIKIPLIDAEPEQKAQFQSKAYQPQENLTAQVYANYASAPAQNTAELEMTALPEAQLAKSPELDFIAEEPQADYAKAREATAKPENVIEFVQYGEPKAEYDRQELHKAISGRDTAESAASQKPGKAQTEQTFRFIEAVKVSAEPTQAFQSTEPEQKQIAQELFPNAKVEIKAVSEQLNELQEFKAAMTGGEKQEAGGFTESKAAVTGEEQAKTTESDVKSKQTETPTEAESAVKPAGAEFSQKPVTIGKTETAQLPQSTTTAIGEEIIARLSEAKNGTTTFEMILNPAELGKITVKLTLGATGIAAEIIAEKASTALMLQNSADRINAALEKTDARIESFSVSAESKPDYNEQRENQDGNRGHYEPEQTEEAKDEDYTISFAELLQAM
jgi:flagellar hook-length control protein FliK